MITYEDDRALREGDDLVLPLGVTLRDGKASVTADPAFREVAESLDSLPTEALFTEETLAALSARCLPLLASLGYEGELHTATVYTLTRREEIPKTCLRADSEALLPDHSYENLTDCVPDPLREGLLCFGTVIDGRILSAASENPHDEGETVIDIGVETAEGYEGRGYAAANVAALAYYLLDPGVTVTYIAEDDNPASHRVALKVGFRPSVRELRLVGYKI